MNSLLVLIPIALFLGLLGLGAFMWAMRTGQFDDLDGAANRILFDDPILDRASPEAVVPEAARESIKGGIP